jgi:hypothetical protein
MIVLFRTLEILAIFSLLGVPFSLFFLPRIRTRETTRWVSARFLLAPATGFAVFAIYTSIFFATRHPVAHAVTAFWPLLIALWIVGAIGYRHFAPHLFSAVSFPRPRWNAVVAHVCVILGLLLVLALHLWPFLQNPALVFWHYGGSDGYMYMRIAEHVGTPGTGVVPTIGPYDAASGFLATEISQFQEGWFTDKPGTMSMLAGLAGLLGLTPHETFSPLVAATMAILYLVLIIFGQSLLRLPVWANVIFACLGTLAPPVWMLATNTFFGNVLALPFYPLLMLLLRKSAPWRGGVYFGLLLAAQMELFPDGIMASAGMLGFATLYLAWTAWRRHRLRRFLTLGLLAIGTAGLVISPFGLRLYKSAFARLMGVAANSWRSLLQGHAPGTSAGDTSTLSPLPKVDWIWGALNLNTIPPQPLKAGEFRYLCGLAVVVGLFLLVSICRRRIGRLFWYLISFLLLLALGLRGHFQSDYEVFRALAVFAFIPLAVLCGLPWLMAGRSHRWRNRAFRIAFIAMIAPLVVHFGQNDVAHFRFGYDEHLPDCQYTNDNLRDRREIGRLGQSHSLVLTSETASFVSLANTIMLFSNVRLGVPEAFHKFVFFGDIGRRDLPYESDLVVRNLRYIDVTERIPGKAIFYRSADFEVVENDLELFYDNDTLPLVNGLPAEYLKKRHYTLTRALSQRTEIKFYSRVRRSVAIELQFAPGEQPAGVPYAFDGGAAQAAVVDPTGRVTLPALAIAPGLHQLALGPLAHPTQITAFRLRVVGEPSTPVALAQK